MEKPPYYVEIHRQADDQFYWRLHSAANHEIVARGESHPTKGNAERAITAIIDNIGGAVSKALFSGHNAMPVEIKDCTK